MLESFTVNRDIVKQFCCSDLVNSLTEVWSCPAGSEVTMATVVTASCLNVLHHHYHLPSPSRDVGVWCRLYCFLFSALKICWWIFLECVISILLWSCSVLPFHHHPAAAAPVLALEEIPVGCRPSSSGPEGAGLRRTHPVRQDLARRPPDRHEARNQNEQQLQLWQQDGAVK